MGMRTSIDPIKSATPVGLMEYKTDFARGNSLVLNRNMRKLYLFLHLVWPGLCMSEPIDFMTSTLNAKLAVRLFQLVIESFVFETAAMHHGYCPISAVKTKQFGENNLLIPACVKAFAFDAHAVKEHGYLV